MLDDHISNLIDLIPKDRSSFDIQRLFFLLTLDSATHFLFGESVGCMLPPSGKTGVLEKCAVGSAQGFANAFGTAQDYLAARSRAQGLYWVVNPKEFREASRQVHEVVDHYVNLALESKRNPEKKIDGRYIFLEALAADTDDPKMLRDNMLNILLAGRDTTASLLSSTFFYLSRHPNVWNRLRREIVEVFGDAKNPRSEMTQTKLKDIPYLRYVLNEGESMLWSILYTLSVNTYQTPIQFYVSSLPCLLTSASRQKTPPYRSVVVLTTNPRSISRRARWLPTAFTLCTAGRTYGARTRLPSGPSAGRKMRSMAGNTFLSMAGRASVLDVSCAYPCLFPLQVTS
jgi:hypothetical protein